MSILKKCTATDPVTSTTITFASRTAAAYWLIKEGKTNYQPNTITKRLAAAMDKNIAEFEYIWNDVCGDNELPTNHNISLLDNNPNYGVTRASKTVFEPIDWEALVAAINEPIEQSRLEAYDNSLGNKNALYHILPHRKTIEDLMRERGIVIPQYNIYADFDGVIYGLNDVGELAILTKTNLTYDDLNEIATCGTLKQFIKIIISDSYIDEFNFYINKFENTRLNN